MRRPLLSSAAVAVAVAGCGGGSSTISVADSPAGAELLGDSPAELKEAGEVQHYFGINCPVPGSIQQLAPRQRKFGRTRSFYEGAEAMCGHIASIEVQGKRVTIRSDIGPVVARQAGMAFCNLMAGSDVADFTKGHELQDLDGRVVKSCPVPP